MPQGGPFATVAEGAADGGADGAVGAADTAAVALGGSALDGAAVDTDPDVVVEGAADGAPCGLRS